MFGFGKKDEYKKFEKLYERIWRKKEAIRDSDKRDAFLDVFKLTRRNELTKGGRVKLALDYGTKGYQVQYTLADLNKMAKAADKAIKEFKEEVRGVPVPQLLKASLPIDMELAKQIRNATLYRTDMEMLFFRVSSSGKDPMKPYHLVKIRLEEWRSQMEKAKGNAFWAVRNAAEGRISFDCSCGRHQFWFRYLATIGGFAVTPPAETVFPKIRNPKLIGCCCKHVLKSISVMQGAAVQAMISKGIEEQAKKKGFWSKLFGKSDSKVFDESSLKDMEKEGNRDVQSAFLKFQAAKSGFKKKMNEKDVQAKVKDMQGKPKKPAAKD
ncbi:MAG: hypothetical protein HQK79_20710 [Desulfobacterales bacterium]|nr:hypothetical protein [Desulfobacterales bacterium]